MHVLGTECKECGYGQSAHTDSDIIILLWSSYSVLAMLVS